MPLPATSVASHGHTEFGFGRSTYDLAARFGRGGVPHRLVYRITPIANEMGQQSHAIVGPLIRAFRLRKLPRHREPVTGPQVADFLPAERAIQAVLAGGANLSSAGQLQFIDRLFADAPGQVGLGTG